MKKLYIFITTLLISLSSFAQDNSNALNNDARYDIRRDVFAEYYSTINSNRPGFSISPYNVGYKYLQFETGFQSNPYKVNSGQSLINSGVDLSVRYGLDLNWEIYSNISPNIDYYNDGTNNKNTFALSPAVVGATYRFTDNKGILPALAISGNFGYYDNRVEKYADVELMLVTQNALGSNISLVTNWKFSQLIKNFNFSYIVTLTASVSDHMVVFVENVGSKGMTDTNKEYVQTAHTGIGYLLNDNLQLDLFGGYNYNFDSYSSYYISAGVSYRIDMKRLDYNPPTGAEKAL